MKLKIKKQMKSILSENKVFVHCIILFSALPDILKAINTMHDKWKNIQNRPILWDRRHSYQSYVKRETKAESCKFSLNTLVGDASVDVVYAFFFLLDSNERFNHLVGTFPIFPLLKNPFKEIISNFCNFAFGGNYPGVIITWTPFIRNEANSMH